ncbi:MAG TPA: polyphosphate kinase 2 family protein [Vicinamibacterales bacterium]|nr:polyphosphate kinase 2 family protein [Vicinamibacterales bacterium]
MATDNSKRIAKLLKYVRVPEGSKVRLKKHDPTWTGSITDEKEASALLEEGIRRLAKQQGKLYAQDTRSLLLIFQAMDAAGKDGTIRHVMSGVNPQGCQVFNFKAPSEEELDHTYLWRSMKTLPERGRIGIHNRSYYEEVLVTKVHPEILASQRLPDDLKDDGVWKRRYREINNFERYLVDNGTVILKFFLNVSKDEQKRRFLARIDEDDKNWKMSVNDVKERTFWSDHMRAYEEMFSNTSTKRAPWHIIPADNKWFTRLAVAAIIYDALERLDLQYPSLTPEKKAELQRVRKLLIAEKEKEE